jgi:cyclopropane fatty-acyl-phospholipid synthase-like methyltransferase
MRVVPQPGRAPVEHFERLAAESTDPWNYATSSYEQAKYRRTLAALPERSGRTLELGCSVGVFTRMLAPRCESLLAVDFSPTALARARERLIGLPQVELARRTLPEQTPQGPFETIVCAELLYYWTPLLVRQGLARLEAALAPGGTLLAVHWRGGDRRRELDGDGVHRILREETGLHWECGEQTPEYLLDRWSAP